LAGSGMVSLGMVLVGWVTLAAVLLYALVIGRAGQMREKHKIAAPAMTGHPDFERAVRVQANTLENLVPFLVCLWLCAIVWWPLFAALMGIVWIIGRGLYAVAYYRDPKGRHIGFGLAALANILLLVGAGYGLLRLTLVLPA
jgi:glutathione S-transferase